MKKAAGSKERRTYDQLKEEILTGVLKPGAVISETEMTQRYKVSQSPVRHAIARAQEAGLLEAIPRRGYTVTLLNLGDIKEILFLRSIVEPEAAALASQQLAEDELSELRELSKISYDIGDRESYYNFTVANKKFHLLIARASRNRRLEAWNSQLLDDLQRAVFHVIAIGDPAAKVAEHERIVEALASRDPDRARQAALKGVQVAMQRISSYLGSAPAGAR